MGKTKAYSSQIINLKSDSISISSGQALGGKGSALLTLNNMGMNVPPGLGVTTESFWAHLKSSGVYDDVMAMEAQLKTSLPSNDDLSEIRKSIISHQPADDLLDQIKSHRQAWLSAGFEFERLIVRSSATVEDGKQYSYAGIFDSITSASDQALASAITEVWASVFSPRALNYYQLGDVNEIPGMALVIQPFIEAQRSGVMFTSFYGPTREQQILIEHVEGDCEKLVSGQINPDRLWLPRWPETEDACFSASSTTPLNASLAKKLASIARQLERDFDGPQDVEWCALNDDIFIVQTRPITATSNTDDEHQAVDDDRLLLSGVPASTGRAGGPAHLVYNIDDADRLQTGSLLVTPMTNPDMVPAMRNSVGVLTDVGGMICHAAIVSRELNIPCVVGTESATSMLKNGDLITLNGTSGEVFQGLDDDSLDHPDAALAPLQWSDLWAHWQTLDVKGYVPAISAIDALSELEYALNAVVLVPYADLMLDINTHTRYGMNQSAQEIITIIDAYLDQAEAIIRHRQIANIYIWPVFLDQHTKLLQTCVNERINMVLLDTTGSTSNADHCSAGPSANTAYKVVFQPYANNLDAVSPEKLNVIPLGASLLSLGDSPAIETRGDQAPAGVFGREPQARQTTMPPPHKREKYIDHIPVLADAYKNRAADDKGQIYPWLDLRPEVVLTPILKSLVLAGVEAIPYALGFKELEPIYVTWKKCRFHFRKDTLFGFLPQLMQATWNADFMATMMVKSRQSYTDLESRTSALYELANDFSTQQGNDLEVCFIPWWRTFVDFFNQTFFIQAQGDDCVYPYLAQTISAYRDKHNDVPGQPAYDLPNIDAFTAPCVPVMTAEYLADLALLKSHSLGAGCSTVDRAVEHVVNTKNAGTPLSEAYACHYHKWRWMRERDPFYPPYDTPELILQKALNTVDAPAQDYAKNVKTARLATSFYFDLSLAEGDPERLVFAVGVGHELTLERENHHLIWLKSSYPFRLLCQEWQSRIERVYHEFSEGDIFFLEIPEILGIVKALPSKISPDFIVKVKNRRLAYETEAKLNQSQAISHVAESEEDYY